MSEKQENRENPDLYFIKEGDITKDHIVIEGDITDVEQYFFNILKEKRDKEEEEARRLNSLELSASRDFRTGIYKVEGKTERVKQYFKHRLRDKEREEEKENEKQDFIKYGDHWMRPFKIEKLKRGITKMKHEIHDEENARVERFNKIYNTSVIDEVFNNNIWRVNSALRCIEKQLIEQFIKTYTDEILSQFEEDKNDNWLNLSQEEVKTKMEGILKQKCFNLEHKHTTHYFNCFSI